MSHVSRREEATITGKSSTSAHSPRKCFEMVSLDILGPYKAAKDSGNRYIILAEDVFSKWVEAIAVPRVDGLALAKFLEEQIVSRYGTPRRVISDHGGQFVSGQYTTWCGENHVEIRYSAPYHQRANPVERRVQELKKTIRTMTYNKSKANWDQHLHKALRVLRTRRNAATGQTPVYTVLGFEPPQAGEWAIRAYQEERRQQSQVLEGEPNQGSAAPSAGVSGQVRSARSGPAKELQSRRPGVRQGITPTQNHIRSPMVGAAPGDRQAVKGSLPSEEGKHQVDVHVDDLREMLPEREEAHPGQGPDQPIEPEGPSMGGRAHIPKATLRRPSRSSDTTTAPPLEETETSDNDEPLASVAVRLKQNNMTRDDFSRSKDGEKAPSETTVRHGSEPEDDRSKAQPMPRRVLQ